MGEVAGFGSWSFQFFNGPWERSVGAFVRSSGVRDEHYRTLRKVANDIIKQGEFSTGDGSDLHHLARIGIAGGWRCRGCAAGGSEERCARRGPSAGQRRPQDAIVRKGTAANRPVAQIIFQENGGTDDVETGGLEEPPCERRQFSL